MGALHPPSPLVVRENKGRTAWYRTWATPPHDCAYIARCVGLGACAYRVAMEEEGGDRFDVHGTCACRIAGAHSLRRLEQQVGCRQCGRHVLVAELCQAQAWRSAADGRRSGYPVAVRTREHARRACLLDGEDGFGLHVARSDGAQPHIVSIHFPKRTSVTVRTKIRISPTRPDPGSTFPYT